MESRVVRAKRPTHKSNERALAARASGLSRASGSTYRQATAPDADTLPNAETASGITDDRPVEFGPLADRLGYVLRRAQLTVFQMFIEALEDHDIRVGQYSVLTIVEHNPGLSQTQVAASLGIKKTNFVAVVDGLEARGLLRRAATPGDRRSYALFLTATGKALMRRLHRIAEAQEQRLVARVGPVEYRRLFAHLGAIASMAKDGSEDET